MMRTYARRNRRKLTDVAAEVIEGRVHLAGAATAPQEPPQVS